MAEIIPDIKTGDIQIAAIARIKDAGCKIAVRSTSGDADSAVGTCVGANAERVRALSLRFPKGSITIVPWSDDIKEFVVNALTPLKASNVDTVEIDEENIIANVKVNSEDAYKKAISKNNAMLASELTGLLINIQGPKRTETMQTPIEELQEKLIKHIPELKNGETEIVRIARIKGVGSRVIVKWKKGRDTKKLMASQACRGRDNEHSKMIQQETMGEWLYFHEWRDDPKEQIMGCLYPLKSSDVDTLELDDKSNTALVTLKDKTDSSPSWRGQYKLALSERVTGWRIEVREKTQQH